MNSTIYGNRVDLAVTGADLVRRLGGHWNGRSGMCRCPAHKDHSPSLSVRIGSTNLLFKCFAGCEPRHVLRAIARLDHRALGQGQAFETPVASDLWLRQRILELWNEAHPVTGTPAERHLQGRGIDRPSPALRYHPRVPLGSRSNMVRRPAMLAAIHGGSGLVALHRTYIDIARFCLARDLAEPRRMLGRPGGGAVMLDRPGIAIGLAEGIETALSASLLLGIPVWAALGNERLARITIPAGVRQVILLPDNDRAGRCAAMLAHDVYGNDGRTVHTILPWHRHNDWNDVLRQDSIPALPVGPRKLGRSPDTIFTRRDQVAGATRAGSETLAQ